MPLFWRESCEAWRRLADTVEVDAFAAQQVVRGTWEGPGNHKNLGPEIATAALPALQAALQDRDNFVRKAAAEAMGSLGPEIAAA